MNTPTQTFKSKKTIFLCASMAFYKELVTIEKQLETKGFTVHIPRSAQIMKEKNDFEVTHFKGVFSYEQRKEFIHDNFQRISEGDSILVINEEKHGVKGYIGTNVLMEVGIASFFGKKIYIWNQVDDSSAYKDELSCLDMVYIDRDLSKII